MLDTLGKILITPGDVIALESPSYLGAISAFSSYLPEYVSVETDDDGIVPESLERALDQQPIKFIYLVTTFQNPTGRTLSVERRRAIAAIIKAKNALVIEDDPYGDLRYRGQPVPPLQTFAPENVVYVSTLSKVFAPGLRLGFSVAPPVIREWLYRAKQGADLHTNTYAQALATEFICGGFIERQVPRIIELYRPRQEAMLAALERHMPGDFRWIKPDGGMFIWVEGPAGTDAEQIYWRAVQQKVAFVPGKYFYIRPEDGLPTMRLNFTRVDETTIETAIESLGRVIRGD